MNRTQWGRDSRKRSSRITAYIFQNTLNPQYDIDLYSKAGSWNCQAESAMQTNAAAKCKIVAIGFARRRSCSCRWPRRSHASLVPAQEVLALRALVCHGVEAVDAARDACAGPQAETENYVVGKVDAGFQLELILPDDAENAGQNPGHWAGFGVCAGGDLALAMWAHHVDAVRAEVGRVDVLHDDWHRGGGRGRRRRRGRA